MNDQVYSFLVAGGLSGMGAIGIVLLRKLDYIARLCGKDDGQTDSFQGLAAMLIASSFGLFGYIAVCLVALCLLGVISP
ncbi:hypothetical protein [Massilia timonae]|uniref:hypothetical protein n=1 Tax=Massilia timonae TaxID=47229 RepID=UPI00289AAC32|nr:hypothetical protein [Massilia timonae]